MSTERRARRLHRSLPTPRAVALLGVAALTVGYGSTLYWVTTVAGGTLRLVAVVALALLAAVAVRRLSERVVLAVAGAAGLLAALWYGATALPPPDATTVTGLLAEPAVLASGNSVLTIAAVDVWVAALAPVPVFASTYLALRRRYVLASLAGGWLLVLLALTGDATTSETLVGTLGVVTAVGFGEIDVRDGAVERGDLVVVLVAAMAVLALAVPLVPSGAASPLDPRTGLGDGGWLGPGEGEGDGAGTGGGPGDGEGDRRAEPVALDEQIISGGVARPGGPIELSPDVRFVVEAGQQRRWRVDVLDYYTGSGWLRTGASTGSNGSLAGSPGPTRTLNQTVDLRAPSEGLPAAAHPVAIEGVPDHSLVVTANGAPTTRLPLEPGEEYRVRSEVPVPSADRLRNASTDYPASIERRYTQLPADFPARVANRTDRVTSAADSPYDAAVAVEAYLRDSYAYSQNVSAPDGDVVDGFLFEMDAGYCTYYASAMAAMLRTQGIPARVAVGYNGGQWAGEDTWVVRGTDAHAWVEVYFPDVGWVEFDPTPTADRRSAQLDAIDRARENGSASVDVPETENRTVRFEPPPDATDDGTDANGSNGTDASAGTADRNETGFDESVIPERYRPGETTNSSELYVDPEAEVGSNRTDATSSEPENDSVAEASRAAARTGHRLLEGIDGPLLALVLAVGGVAGVRRTRVYDRAVGSTSLLWQRRGTPASDVERAVRRLDRLVGRRHRARRPGETRREYLAALPADLDPRVRRAYRLHERARYAGDVDAGTADELVALVDELVREDLPIVGRLRE